MRKGRDLGESPSLRWTTAGWSLARWRTSSLANHTLPNGPTMVMLNRDSFLIAGHSLPSALVSHTHALDTKANNCWHSCACDSQPRDSFQSNCGTWVNRLIVCELLYFFSVILSLSFSIVFGFFIRSQLVSIWEMNGHCSLLVINSLHFGI